MVEKVHELAYREAGLGRSLYAPYFMMAEYSPDLLSEFVNQNFTADRMSLSAAGLSLADVTSLADRFDVDKSNSGSDAQSKYYGGAEARASTEELVAYSILVSESVR